MKITLNFTEYTKVYNLLTTGNELVIYATVTPVGTKLSYGIYDGFRIIYYNGSVFTGTFDNFKASVQIDDSIIFKKTIIPFITGSVLLKTSNIFFRNRIRSMNIDNTRTYEIFTIPSTIPGIIVHKIYQRVLETGGRVVPGGGGPPGAGTIVKAP